MYVRRSSIALTLLAGTSMVAAAQGTTTAPAQPACSPNQNSPEYIALATFSMNRAFTAMKGGPSAADTVKVKGQATGLPTAPGVVLDAKKELAGAIGTLTTIPKKKPKDENLLAKNFMLAQAYILIMQQPGVPVIVRRADIGMTEDPEGTIDLFMAADSALSFVEANAPECREFMGQWRQQKPWLSTLNASLAALNAGKLDSAEYLVNRSLILDKTNPYAYSVLAGIAKSKKDYAKAEEFWKKALETAGTDSNYTDIRNKTIFDMASTATSLVESAPAGQKRSAAQAAIEAWKRYLANATNDYMITNAQQQMMKLYITSGDSLKIPEIFTPMIDAPAGKYGEVSLLNGGIVAMRFKRTKDAAKLFEAALAANPYSRDVLNGLAASLIGSGDYEKALPLIDKLVTLDPNNPDNWSLYAYAYSIYLKNPKNPALTKAYTDSLLKYNAKAEQMPVKVTFNEFSRGDEETVVAGTIENRSKTSQTYNMVVEFLNKDGKVVGTQSAKVGPIVPKGNEDFTVILPVTAETKGVVGFRYKPL